MTESGQRDIVVLGAGFGGLEFCKRFPEGLARITLVDRTNHHLFQPLLYQVATAGLSAPDIAQPVRSILSNRRDVTVLMDTVRDFDLPGRKVRLGENVLEYDYLVLALGGCTSYFGHPEWEPFAPGLKSLMDAVRIRSRILLAFEQAEMEASPDGPGRLLTIAVVGGGPTGVELAGACAELARHVLRADFRRIDPAHARVILIEGESRVLANLTPELSASAQRQLEHLGVQVRTGARVRNIREGEVELENGETIHAANIIWAAGVGATPLTRKLGVELDRSGRVKVKPDLSLPGRPEVFAIGDMALVLGPDGKPVPGVSPAAMQMGDHVARLIEKELAHSGALKRAPFKYWDKGTMATIGRSAAVAQVGKFEFSGVLAWLAWLMVHLVFLVGFRNKISVLMQWFYSYVNYKRGARIITNADRLERLPEFKRDAGGARRRPGKFQYRRDPVPGDAGKPFEKPADRRAIFEILEQRLNRDARTAENPGATHLAGHAFHRLTFSQIKHGNDYAGDGGKASNCILQMAVAREDGTRGGIQPGAGPGRMDWTGIKQNTKEMIEFQDLVTYPELQWESLADQSRLWLTRLNRARMHCGR